MNETIRELHESLIKTHQALSRRLGKTLNPDDAEAVLREMEEVNFRVMMAGRLLFKECSSAIELQIETLVSAGKKLDQHIGQIAKTTSVVKKIGKFLTAVDKVLDALKAI